MTTRTNLGALLVLGALLAGPAQAQSVGLTAQVGTMGPGVGLSVGLTSQLSARVNGHLFTYSHADTFEDAASEVSVDYQADLRVGGASALLDWHPGGGGFRLTGGAFYNDTNVAFSGKPSSPYRYSDTKSFAPEKLGTLAGTMEYAPVSPYVGIGFGNAARRRVSFSVDMGVLYTGAPKVSIEGTGMIAPTASHAPTINAGLESFQFYPYFNLGLGLGFGGR